jgi:hypothetical protein
MLPFFDAIPTQPLRQTADGEEDAVAGFLNRQRVLDVHRYADRDDLLGSFATSVIAPAEAMLKELGRERPPG